jgi:hypothetical protein
MRSRVLIGHPFNPPHLIPLVEIVPGKRTSKEAVAEAVQFYTAIGKSPIVIEKEIPGFVANRLQSALLRESVYLVSQGVVDMESLDQIVSSSIGFVGQQQDLSKHLRWAEVPEDSHIFLNSSPHHWKVAGKIWVIHTLINPLLTYCWSNRITAMAKYLTTNSRKKEINNSWPFCMH